MSVMLGYRDVTRVSLIVAANRPTTSSRPACEPLFHAFAPTRLPAPSVRAFGHEGTEGKSQ